MSVTNGNDSGPGSLRDAIATSDVVTINPGLTIAVLTPITITHPVIIEGNGSTIVALPTVNGYLFVVDVNQSAEFRDITFRSVSPSNSLIRSTSASLALTRCIIDGWTPSANLIRSDSVNLSIVDCVFSNNASNLLIQTIQGDANIHFVSIKNSVFKDNRVISLIVVELNGTGSANPYFADVTLEDLVIDSNRFGIASFIDINRFGTRQFSIIMRNITVTNNFTTASGYVVIEVPSIRAKEITIQNVTFKNNNAARLALEITGGLAANDIPTNITVDNISITDNNVTGDVFVYMLASKPGTTSVVSKFSNITVANNTTPPTGSLIMRGMLISGVNNDLTVSNVTIANNGNPPRDGLYLSITGSYPPRVHNATVLASITSLQLTPSLYNTIVGTLDGTFDPASANNIILGSSSNLIDGVNNNRVGINPMLGPFDYSGRVPVLPLLKGSPAIDAGDNAYVVDNFDARGMPFRRIYNVVDIGAYEWQPTVTTGYLATSLVRVLDSCNVTYIYASDVTSNHYVYDVRARRYVRVLRNVRVSAAASIQQVGDLFISAGQLILQNGVPTQAGIPTNILTNDVFVIITDIPRPIDINGVGVYTWSMSKWSEYAQANSLQIN